MISQRGDLKHLNVFALPFFVVARKFYVLGKLILVISECISKKIIQSLIISIILLDMTKEYLNVYIAILARSHILLVIASCEKEITWTFLYLVIDLKIVGDIIPIGIEDKSYLFNLAILNDPDNSLRKITITTKILYSGDCN